MTWTGIDEPIRLLLVEDDPESGEALRSMLEKRGVGTRMATAADEGFRAFKEGPFDIVVADIRLRGKSGVDLLGDIRADNPDFPVILLTGFDSLESAIQAVRLGAQDYILKPLDDVDDLLLPIRKAVRGHRLLLQNRLLEEERKHAHEELRALSARLVETEESERRRLGQELHDQVGQTLSTLGISLTLAKNQLSAGCDPAVVQRLEDALEQIEELAEQLRHVMSELRPPVLDDYGLPAALRWLGRQFSQRTGIPVDVQVPELAHRPPSAVETALFRIAQEALNNVAKHARAKKAIMTLEETPTGLRLSIADDGIGFDPSGGRGPSARTGWGLISMRERTTAAGGQMKVHSELGGGTRVVVETGS